MSNERIKELFDNMLFHISELVSSSDLVNTLVKSLLVVVLNLSQQIEGIYTY